MKSEDRLIRTAHKAKAQWEKLDKRSKKERAEDISAIQKTSSRLLKLISTAHNRLILNEYKLGTKMRDLGHGPSLLDFGILHAELQKVIRTCTRILNGRLDADYPERSRQFLPSHKGKETTVRNFLIDKLLVEFDEPSLSQTQFFNMIAIAVNEVSGVFTTFDDVKARGKSLERRMERDLKVKDDEIKKLKFSYAEARLIIGKSAREKSSK